MFRPRYSRGKSSRYSLDRKLDGPLDDEEKRKFLTLLGLKLRPVGRSTRSQLLYRLRYPGSAQLIIN
jgi:hypothetical protein